MFKPTPFRIFAIVIALAGAYLWPTVRWNTIINECTDRGEFMDYANRICTPVQVPDAPPKNAWFEKPETTEIVLGLIALPILLVIFHVKDRVEDNGA